MSKLLYRKFIQDNMYQILSESTGFCERYDKKIVLFFRFTVYTLILLLLSLLDCHNFRCYVTGQGRIQL